MLPDKFIKLRIKIFSLMMLFLTQNIIEYTIHH